MAFGDSLTAGISLPGYIVPEIVDLTKDVNDILPAYPTNSPKGAYINLLGALLQQPAYNLAQPGEDSNTLLAKLQNSDYLNSIKPYLNDSTKFVTVLLGDNDFTLRFSDYINSNIDPKDKLLVHGCFLYLTAPNEMIELLSRLSPQLTESLPIDIDINNLNIQSLFQLLSESISNPDILLSPKTVITLLKLLNSTQITKLADTAITKFKNNFPSIIEKLREKVPNAKIVPIGFYNPYDSDASFPNIFSISSITNFAKSIPGLLLSTDVLQYLANNSLSDILEAILINHEDNPIITTAYNIIKLYFSDFAEPLIKYSFDKVINKLLGVPLDKYITQLNGFIAEYSKANNLNYVDISDTVSRYDLGFSFDPHTTEDGQNRITNRIYDALGIQ